ncbi:uncharacterized protein CLUP02_03831 [Colletotrichum lupini]|uniref:Uncharacterized protein n=1 Tax=Colletotrichum lupini TaxID=145971 RepID=A0A9Q8WCJ1_9PEZI|nr:uncharacterized protein CLUP02_03831 [Colletotrichum lupini]UQC78354.1 hypothetical protein CLUP02_03831 [Colletotrichum lupini]
MEPSSFRPGGLQEAGNTHLLHLLAISRLPWYSRMRLWICGKIRCEVTTEDGADETPSDQLSRIQALSPPKPLDCLNLSPRYRPLSQARHIHKDCDASLSTRASIDLFIHLFLCLSHHLHLLNGGVQTLARGPRSGGLLKYMAHDREEAFPTVSNRLPFQAASDLPLASFQIEQVSNPTWHMLPNLRHATCDQTALVAIIRLARIAIASCRRLESLRIRRPKLQELTNSPKTSSAPPAWYGNAPINKGTLLLHPSPRCGAAACVNGDPAREQVTLIAWLPAIFPFFIPSHSSRSQNAVHLSKSHVRNPIGDCACAALTQLIQQYMAPSARISVKFLDFPATETELFICVRPSVAAETLALRAAMPMDTQQRGRSNRQQIQEQPSRAIH